MDLIIGGAYQGKLDYARRAYKLGDGDIFDCKSANEDAIWPTIELTHRVIYHLEDFIWACVREGVEAQAYLEANIEALANKIIIADDITQGVVPMDATERVWREELGRCLVYLGQHADRVTRVFCGIPQQIKGQESLQS